MDTDPDRTATNVSAGHSTMRIMVTGGGTGGHTTPAVAVIQEIRKQAAAGGGSPQFCYLGSKTGIEASIAHELQVDFVGIQTGKLRRARSIVGLLSAENLKDALRVPIGYAQAVGAVRRFRPEVIFSTGGYVSVPGVLAASALKISVVAHEQTIQVGLANKINFRAARVIALSVPETMAELRDRQRKRAIVTGNPVREIIFHGEALRAARQFGFAPSEDKMPTVYVTGGAQGSRLINENVETCLAELLGLCRIIHQCGVQPQGTEQDFERLQAARKRLPEHLKSRYAVTKYVGPEIGDVYALADLVLARSGAGTVTELCALGKPGLFVPLVPTGGDEQTRNAKRLVDAGAAKMLDQSSLDALKLYRAVQLLLEDRVVLDSMGRAALRLAKPDAARKLAEIVIESGKIA